MLGLFNLGPQEIIVLLVLGVLLFGKRLPEVGQYIGKGLREFQNSFRGIESDVAGALHRHEVASVPAVPSRITQALPKFEDNGTGPAPAV